MKKIFKKAFALIGLEIKRTGRGLCGCIFPLDKYISKVGGHSLKFAPSEKDRFKWLQHLNINTVIDIGANTGSFALEIHKILPRAKIYLFEPLEDCFRQLKENFKDLSYFQLFNIALGDKKGDTIIYHNEFPPCSSMLEGTEILREQLPFAQNVTKEVVKIDTLDNIAEKITLKENILIKMDVQGFEDRVIAGGRDVLKHSKLIIIETSFQEIYKGQPLFSNIYEVLINDLNFAYVGNWEQEKSPLDGAPFQETSLFIK